MYYIFGLYNIRATNMKITPFILFLILLFVLVLSILFSKFLPLSSTTEGFVAFKQDKSQSDFVLIPQYSTASTVVKLYDNLFYDTKNSNIIEVDGNAFVGNTAGGNVTANTRANTASSSSGIVDSMGISVTGVYIIKRDGSSNVNQFLTKFTDNTKSSVVATDTSESSIPTVNSQYSQWVYSTKCTKTDPYQLFYVAWDTKTFIHVIKTGTSPIHIGSYMFDINNSRNYFMYPTNLSISISTPTADTDSANGTFVIDSLYDSKNKVYQISHTVEFDPMNANLIIKNDPSKPGVIKVYNRKNTVITDYTNNKQTNVTDTGSTFQPWIVSDAAGNMLVYMPLGTNTLVAILQMDPANAGKFKFSQVARFNSTGIDTSTTSGQPRTPSPGESTAPGSEYYKWLAYWNTVVNSSGSYSEDYLLKTQIVPPVCPSCPSCPSSGGGASACTNCGGQGGSGTQGISVSGNNATVMGSGTFGTNANADTLGGATTIQTLGAVAGVEDVAKTGAGVVTGVVGTAGKTVGGVVDTAGKVAGGVVGTAGHLLESTGSGAVDLTKTAIGETTGLLRDAGSGAVSILKQGDNRTYQQGSGPASQQQQQGGAQRQGGAPAMSGWNQSTAGNGIDNYSYYGALQPKGSNYIPVTANFSAFSK